MSDCAIRDEMIHAMQDVEEQRLKNLRVGVHPLEVEALKLGKTHSVFGIVKEKAELPAFSPFLQSQRQPTWECVGKHSESPQLRGFRSAGRVPAPLQSRGVQCLGYR